MKLKLKLVLAFLFIGIASIISQTNKLDAHGNIKMLKQGVLFVRLKTSDLAVSALKKEGREKAAEELKLKQEAENRAVANAFKMKFNFCPVYFFYSTNSTEIKKGNCRDVLFDVNFQKISLLNCNDFLVGEFDESNTTHLEAFIVKDKNFEQLNSPFPFLIKKNAIGVKTRTVDEIISELNTKLYDFLGRNK